MNMKIEDYTINVSEPIREALKRLNLVKSRSMTLFVVDDNGVMVGTLTDGDVRRALIAGHEVNSPVGNAMHRDFSYLRSLSQAYEVKQMRQRGILLVPVLDTAHHILDVIDLTRAKAALPVDAVLMAGGKGERLRPLTLTTPKPLLKIGSKPIIDLNIDALAKYGVKDFSVTVNYLKEQLIEHFSVPTEAGAEVKCVAETQFFGTIGSLKLVPEFHNDAILVMNSDLLTDIDYEDFYLHFKQNGAMMSAAAVPYTISVPYGIFDIDGRNILGVEEKPVYNMYANAGIYLIRREALRYIPEGRVFNATDLIQALVADHQPVIRYPLTGLWIDIGTPDEYRKAQDLAKHL